MDGTGDSAQTLGSDDRPFESSISGLRPLFCQAVFAEGTGLAAATQETGPRSLLGLALDLLVLVSAIGVAVGIGGLMLGRLTSGVNSDWASYEQVLMFRKLLPAAFPLAAGSSFCLMICAGLNILYSLATNLGLPARSPSASDAVPQPYSLDSSGPE